MEGRRPNGLTVVLANCNDPAQEADFDRWYNKVHLPDICDAGLFPRATRYENPKAQGGSEEPRYLALYETDRNDPGSAWAENRKSIGDLREQGRIHRALQSSFVGVYERRVASKTDIGKKTTGVLVVLTDCADPAREDEFNIWYDDVHIPDIVATGAYQSAARYENTSNEPGQPQYLAVYETDAADPIAQLAAMQAKMKSMNAKRIDFIKMTLLMPYAMTYSTVSGPISAKAQS